MSEWDLAGLVGPEFGAEDDDLEFGARARRRARRAMPMLSNRAQRVRAAEARTMPAVPGVPAMDAAVLPLGFPLYTFNATSGTALTQTVNPQSPFRGRRFVISIGRNGASATGLITVASVRIGTREIIVSDGPVPADAFAPNAYDTDLLLPPVQPGSVIRVQLLASSAPTGTDSITVSVALIGSSII